MTHVTTRRCATYAIVHAPGAVTGSWHRLVYRSPHVRESILYPTFQAPGETISEWVTGYSYGCGDVNGITADGSVPQPYFTVASNDPALWHRRIYVPSLGFHGYVQDTGAPFDLFMPSCGAAMTVTGERAVIVY